VDVSHKKMSEGTKKEQNRESLPDFVDVTGFSFDALAGGLLQDMGFAVSEPEQQTEPPEAESTPPAPVQPIPAQQPETTNYSEPSIPLEVESRQDTLSREETPPPKKKRLRMFPTTRGEHIRFIIVVVAILVFEMFFIGFLTSAGVLDINISN
jgi:hypothetical protein